MGGGGFGGGSAEPKTTQRPFVTSAALAVDAGSNIDLKQGVASAANAEDVGELFRYVINSPVTLDRNESAMLPIVNDTVRGEKVAIYNPAVHAKHPLSGLRLTNSTPLHLLQGPITLFDGSEYAGDARIEDIPPGSTRLISYALDLETEIAVEDKPIEETLVRLQIHKGGLHMQHKATRQVHYVIKNSSDRVKQVLVERLFDPAWKLMQPDVAEKTRSVVRFAAKAEPGKPETLVITEEQDRGEDFALATLAPTQLQFYLHLPVASPALKKALEQALERKTIAAEAQAKRLATERRISELSSDQERVLRNLNGVPYFDPKDPFADVGKKEAAELRQRFFTKLADLESEIEKQQTRLDSLKLEEGRANRELERYLQELVVE
jgi:hypothetical protein